MHHLNKLVCFLLLPLATVLSAASLADEHVTQEPAALLIEQLEALESLHASYEQTNHSSVQSGEFWLQKPGKFRVESDPPLSQTIVSDGSSLWTHDQDLEQVIISNLDDNADNIPILLFAGDPSRIRETYSVESFDDEHLRYFILRPLNESGVVGGVGLAFDGSLPVRLSFENAMHERTVIRFQNVSSDLGSTSPFTFELPEFVDVIDDRGSAD